MFDFPAVPAPDGPLIEVYYASSCTPCRLELPVLAELSESERTRMVIVLLTEEKKAREEIVAVSPKLETLAILPSGHDSRKVLQAAGDAEGILPYARSLHSNGQICKSWRGLLNVDRVRKMLRGCK